MARLRADKGSDSQVERNVYQFAKQFAHHKPKKVKEIHSDSQKALCDMDRQLFVK